MADDTVNKICKIIWDWRSHERRVPVSKKELAAAARLCSRALSKTQNKALKKNLARLLQLLDAYLPSKRVVITGGLGGIGQAAAYACWERGADVTIVARDGPKHQVEWKDFRQFMVNWQSAEHVPPLPPQGKCKLAIADVTSERDWKKVAAEIKKDCRQHKQPLHGVFINAGHEGPCKTVEDIGAPDFESQVRVNDMGTAFTLKNLLPVMRELDSYGTFVLCSSKAATAKWGRPSHPLYASSKAAAESLMRSTSGEWKDVPRHPGFIIIRPENVDTPLARRGQKGMHGPPPNRHPRIVGDRLAELLAGKHTRRSDIDDAVLLEVVN